MIFGWKTATKQTWAQPADRIRALDPRVGNLDPSIKAMQAARMAAGRFFQVPVVLGVMVGGHDIDMGVFFPTKTTIFAGKFILEKNFMEFKCLLLVWSLFQTFFFDFCASLGW